MSDVKCACSECNVTFANNQNLLRHRRRFHSQKLTTICNQICGICSDKFRTILDLHNHIEKKHHEINLHFEEKLFYCQEDFDKWKTEIERETSSSYVLNFSRKTKDVVSLQYRCNRSGSFISKKKSERKRHLKIKGSIKTGVTCPSVMKVTKQLLNGTIEIVVTYQSTHIGHKCDKNVLPLQRDTRANIADMLDAKIPPTAVLDKLQECSPLKKEKRLLRQDIYNVASDVNINKLPHKDDLKSVDIIVNKMKEENYNPVLIYKPLGEAMETNPNIKKEDYILDIASEDKSEDKLVIDALENENFQNEEKNIILKQVYKKQRLDIDNEKSEIKVLLQSISTTIQNTDSADDISYVKDQLKNIQVYLNSTVKPANLLTAEISKKIPSNKIINVQRNIKNRKQTKKHDKIV